MEAKVITDTLRKCELFSDLSDEELNSIAELGRVEKYDAGDTIYEQGGIGTKLYVLFKGQVSLHRRFKLDDTRMANTTVYVLRKNVHRRLMGCWCTLVGKQHTQMCSARCDKPSKLVSINCSGLREIIVENSNIRVKILERLVLILRDRLEVSYAAMETL